MPWATLSMSSSRIPSQRERDEKIKASDAVWFDPEWLSQLRRRWLDSFQTINQVLSRLFSYCLYVMFRRDREIRRRDLYRDESFMLSSKRPISLLSLSRYVCVHLSLSLSVDSDAIELNFNDNVLVRLTETMTTIGIGDRRMSANAFSHYLRRDPFFWLL